MIRRKFWPKLLPDSFIQKVRRPFKVSSDFLRKGKEKGLPSAKKRNRKTKVNRIPKLSFLTSKKETYLVIHLSFLIKQMGIMPREKDHSFLKALASASLEVKTNEHHSQNDI